MKWLRYGLLLLTSTLFSVTTTNLAFAQGDVQLTGDQISGESAVLIDAKSGQVLFEKNPDLSLYPASITKIATGIYAIENGNPDDIVTVSKRARSEEGTRVYLAEGEQVSLRKLEYGLLMNSGNDAATAIAEHMSGSVEQFADKLNRFLQEKVGVSRTHFANAHGLHDPNHYTTASDMAKIARYAMKNPIFREIVATKTLPWDGKEWKTVLVNHNKMLWNYEGTTGIKNGFTDQARNTLVVSAKRNGSEFIAVTMKAQSSNYSYKDVTRMLDYAFAHYETKQVAKAGEMFTYTSLSDNHREEFTAKEDCFVTLPRGSHMTRELTPEGQLLVQAGDLKKEFLLEHKEHPQQLKASTDSSVSQQVSTTSLARYLLLFSWLLLNIMLILYSIERARRKRRISSYQIRRRADWS